MSERPVAGSASGPAICDGVCWAASAGSCRCRSSGRRSMCCRLPRWRWLVWPGGWLRAPGHGRCLFLGFSAGSGRHDFGDLDADAVGQARAALRVPGGLIGVGGGDDDVAGQPQAGRLLRALALKMSGTRQFVAFSSKSRTQGRVEGGSQGRHGHDHRDRPVELCMFGDTCAVVAVASIGPSVIGTAHRTALLGLCQMRPPPGTRRNGACLGCRLLNRNRPSSTNRRDIRSPYDRGRGDAA